MRLVEQDPCFKSALPDEPAYVLLARDESAPKLVRQWAAIRQALISAGLKPESDQRQVDESYALADQMEAWRRDADEAWRNQPQLAFPPVSDGRTFDTFGHDVDRHDAFHDAVLHGVGVTQGGKHVPLDLMHEHGNVERQSTHLLDRQGDEFFCPRCAKRWGTDEPAPACK